MGRNNHDLAIGHGEATNNQAMVEQAGREKHAARFNKAAGTNYPSKWFDPYHPEKMNIQDVHAMGSSGINYGGGVSGDLVISAKGHTEFADSSDSMTIPFAHQTWKEGTRSPLFSEPHDFTGRFMFNVDKDGKETVKWDAPLKGQPSRWRDSTAKISRGDM